VTWFALFAVIWAACAVVAWRMDRRGPPPEGPTVPIDSEARERLHERLCVLEWEWRDSEIHAPGGRLAGINTPILRRFILTALRKRARDRTLYVYSAGGGPMSAGSYRVESRKRDVTYPTCGTPLHALVAAMEVHREDIR
jgi:hypothetical protein